MEALGPDEEFGILYTGQIVADAGVRLRASYTSQVTPSAINGLLGQKLLADYTLRSPDTFFYRVETLTNFRGEYAAEIASQASSGSSGPQTSNISQPELFEQGRKSLYFDERHLANQDYIARSTLLFYNDLANYLEAYRREVDGTVVGNNDGELLFDGTVGSTHPPGSVTNQIDDTIKVSDAPYAVTYPPYGVTSIGTFKKYYLPGPLSRFFPTSKNFFGVTINLSTAVNGTEVLDTKSTHITQASNLHLRQAWGTFTEDTRYSGKDPSGNDILKLDFASGNEAGFTDQVEKYARLGFVSGMKCGVIAHDGTVINPPSSPVVIVDVSDFQVTISGGLLGSVPVGATLYQLQSDDSGYMFTYSAGADYSFNPESGQVTYVPDNGKAPPANNVPLIGPYPYSGTVTLSNTLTEPLKFPALFGGIEDDDGDLSFPIQTPDPNSERDSYLATESKLIATGTGLIRTRTQAPIISTGSVVSPNFHTIVDATIGSMSPAPQVGDLVRILTGANSGTAFRRIVSVSSGSLNVDATAPNYAVSAGFSYELAVSPNIASGSATSGNSFQLTDTSASFLSTVKVGYTIVVTVAGNMYRRQVYDVNSNTTVSFFPSVPSPVVLFTPYRFDNSLATYGNRSGSGSELDYLQEWDAALAGEQTLYPDEQTNLLAAIDQALTDVVTGSAGQTTGPSTFVDSTATFLDDGVLAGQFVYIQSGSNAGLYAIQSVNSQVSLTITSTFPVVTTGITYRIASMFGLSEASAQSLFALYQDIAALITPLSALRAKLAPASVVGFDSANTFAVGVLSSDLDARELQVAARLTDLASIPDQIADILASTDKVYDKRYVWIDARINLESGLLVQQETAVKNRIKAQADVLKQLTKLLAVEGS
jgi:hypothetical protein